WVLYYPAILDVGELGMGDGLKAGLRASLEAYRNGDLLQALTAYPEGRVPASDEERVYLAALVLAVGQVGEAEKLVQAVKAAPRLDAFAEALRRLIAAVKFQPATNSVPLRAGTARSGLATQKLSESYYQQSQRNLPAALAAAREA